MSMIPIDEGDIDALDWLFAKFQTVVWAERPRDQVAANLFLTVLAAVASFVSLGLTLVLAAIFGAFATVGLARLAYRLVTESSNGDVFIVTVGIATTAIFTLFIAAVLGPYFAAAYLVLSLVGFYLRLRYDA